MREHLFRRRRGFDSTQIVTVSTYEGEMGRSFATRHWGFTHQVPGLIAKAARAIQTEAFADGVTQSDLWGNRVMNFGPRAAELQAENFLPLTNNVRAAFGVDASAEVERSMWLVCHEVEFHEDIVLADSAAFLIWHVGGPAKAVDFPNLGFGVVMEPGDALLFDGMQPHGVRLVKKAGLSFGRGCQAIDPPETAEDITVFLSLDVPLTPELSKKMGIKYGTSPMSGCVNASVDEATGRAELRFW